MDLLATVRKEGSRGGAGDFKWSDVQNSSRRENYLGHSLMAPVGRWQKGRDLNWYARKDQDGEDGEDAEAQAARERREEIRRVKEAEEDALARALGLPVAPRSNANMEPLGDKRDIDKIVKTGAGEEDGGGKGVGYGALDARSGDKVMGERIEGNAEPQDRELQYALKEYRRRQRDGGHRHRSRSREPERRHRHRDRDRDGRRRKHRSRSRSRERHHRLPRRSARSSSESRSRSGDRDRRNDRRRSRSPYQKRRDDRHMDRGQNDRARTRRS